MKGSNILSANTLYHGWMCDRLSVCTERARVIQCHISAWRTMSQAVIPFVTWVHAQCFIRAGSRSQLCSGVDAPLTLYENAHISTAEVDVIGNLTPVNSRVIPVEGTQEEQSAVHYFHPFWHFTVQPVMRKRHKHLDTHTYNKYPVT